MITCSTQNFQSKPAAVVAQESLPANQSVDACLQQLEQVASSLRLFDRWHFNERQLIGYSFSDTAETLSILMPRLGDDLAACLAALELPLTGATSDQRFDATLEIHAAKCFVGLLYGGGEGHGTSDLEEPSVKDLMNGVRQAEQSCMRAIAILSQPSKASDLAVAKEAA